MDFAYSDEEKAIKTAAQDFARKELLPNLERWEKEGKFPKETLRKIGELGFFGAVIPAAYGGTEAGYLAHALIVEEFTRVTPIFSSSFNVQAASVPKATLVWGTEEQKRLYVEKLVKGEIIGCHALTEPGAGSDFAGIQTTAIRKGNKFILNGTKMWITYAPVADVALVFAKTIPKEKHKGISAFLIPMNIPGVKTYKMDAISASNALPTGEIVFEDCEIPEHFLLGPENMGFKVAMKMLDSTRVTIPARCIGNAQACIDASVKYAKEREAFGVTIGHYQMIKSDIAEMIARTEAGRMLVHRLAWLTDQGNPTTLEGSIAKLYCGELAFWVANKAQFIHGAYGFHREYPVARIMAEAQFMRIAEGTSNIHRLIISDDALGFKKANRSN